MATETEKLIVAVETKGSKKAVDELGKVGKAAGKAEKEVEGLQQQTQKYWSAIRTNPRRWCAVTAGN